MSMKKFLKIENPGTCDSKSFVILGASFSDSMLSQERRELLIGNFGSGCKNSICVLLRNKLAPIVFCSSLKMEFSTEEVEIREGKIAKNISQVQVKYSGKEYGKSKSTTELLSMTDEFGKINWDKTELALREFVSNAIDSCIKASGNWSGVDISIVDENQVRAKTGTTRVFIPVNEDVLKFYLDIGKWFLHFSEPESILKTVLPKKDRNFTDKKMAVVYRRGVFIREFNPHGEKENQPSMFDYNLRDLTLGEDRKASDWDVKYYCGQALANIQDVSIAGEFLDNFGKDYWEAHFDDWAMSGISYNQGIWQEAYKKYYGDSVVCTEEKIERVKRKGYSTVKISDQQMSVFKKIGIKTQLDILSKDEIDGLEMVRPTQEMVEVLDEVWEMFEDAHLTMNEEKPPLYSFSSCMNAGEVMRGFWRDDKVYIKDDLSGKALKKVMIEECTHHCTKATDLSRGFQSFLLDLIVNITDRSLV